MALDRKRIDECVHCGFCLPACPTYRSWGQEMDSPRGRIYLMKAHDDGRQPLGDKLVQHFDRCLGCLACMTACPSGVRYDELIERMREEIETRVERPLADRLLRGLIFALLPHRARLRLMALLSFAYQRSGLRWLVRRLGLLEALSPRLAAMEALAPSVPPSQAFSNLPRTTPAEGHQRARVVLLAGCVQSVYFSEVNRATVRVLAAEGCEVVVPPGLGCCGALSTHAGRNAEARSFARQVIERVESMGIDAIVVGAAGCGAAMKHYGRLLEGDADWEERARDVGSMVRDVNEWLVELGPRARRHPLPVTVAYHDACHLSHGQGIRSQPRELLAAIPGLELREIPEADQCCGSAGIYNLLEPESASEIGARKARSVLSVEAALLASANPGCSLQIAKHLAAAGKPLRVAHPVELLDASIRGVELDSA